MLGKINAFNPVNYSGYNMNFKANINKDTAQVKELGTLNRIEANAVLEEAEDYKKELKQIQKKAKTFAIKNNYWNKALNEEKEVTKLIEYAKLNEFKNFEKDGVSCSFERTPNSKIRIMKEEKDGEIKRLTKFMFDGESSEIETIYKDYNISQTGNKEAKTKYLFGRSHGHESVLCYENYHSYRNGEVKSYDESILVSDGITVMHSVDVYNSPSIMKIGENFDFADSGDGTLEMFAENEVHLLDANTTEYSKYITYGKLMGNMPVKYSKNVTSKAHKYTAEKVFEYNRNHNFIKMSKDYSVESGNIDDPRKISATTYEQDKNSNVVVKEVNKKVYPHDHTIEFLRWFNRK